MVFFVDLFEALVGDVGVDLSCTNRAVAEQRLNRSNVGSIFQKVCCKAVAKNMGSDLFDDAGFDCVFFCQTLDGSGRESQVFILLWVFDDSNEESRVDVCAFVEKALNCILGRF